MSRLFLSRNTEGGNGRAGDSGAARAWPRLSPPASLQMGVVLGQTLIEDQYRGYLYHLRNISIRTEILN
eukprot:COSAG01_NODE_5234_length_4395_cov_65.796555_3_plen_69_part_00